MRTYRKDQVHGREENGVGELQAGQDVLVEHDDHDRSHDPEGNDWLISTHVRPQRIPLLRTDESRNTRWLRLRHDLGHELRGFPAYVELDEAS